jgi:hypothetical protein
VADGTYDFGILACTSGVGMCIAANRHRHVRAANVRSVEETVTTREHNDSNVLCLSGKYTDEATAIAMADAFLATAFSEGRHEKRVVTVLQEFGFPPDAVSTGMITDGKKIIRMGFEPMRLELFTSIPGIEFSGCYERRNLVKVGRMMVPFISLEDLKINKLASGRPKDLQDLEELP